MTEAEWLSCEDPGRMLRHLETGGPARDSGRTLAGFPVKLATRHPVLTDRKLRLFACGCLRYSWRGLTAPDSRPTVELAELIADGYARPIPTIMEDPASLDQIGICGPDAMAATNYGSVYAGNLFTGRPDQAALLRCLVGNPWRPIFHPDAVDPKFATDELRPPHLLSPDWLRWNGGAVPKLARAIYDGRDWGALPVLADALEEAGCPAEEECPKCDGRGANEPDAMNTWRCGYCNGTGRAPNPVPAHLRGPGPHAKGCWVLDLILGKG